MVVTLLACGAGPSLEGELASAKQLETNGAVIGFPGPFTMEGDVAAGAHAYAGIVDGGEASTIWDSESLAVELDVPELGDTFALDFDGAFGVGVREVREGIAAGSGTDVAFVHAVLDDTTDLGFARSESQHNVSALMSGTPNSIAGSVGLLGAFEAAANKDEEECDGPLPPPATCGGAGNAMLDSNIEIVIPFTVEEPVHVVFGASATSPAACDLDKDLTVAVAGHSINLQDGEGGGTFDIEEPGDYAFVLMGSHLGVGAAASTHVASIQEHDSCVLNSQLSGWASFSRAE